MLPKNTRAPFRGVGDDDLDTTPPDDGPPGSVRRRVRSSVGIHFHIDDATAGWMVFASSTTAFFGPAKVETCEIFVDHAFIALTSSRRAEATHHLTNALDHSRQIGVAMGILMQSHTIDAATAFDQLRTASSHLNRKLYDIAQHVAEAGTLPQHQR